MADKGAGVTAGDSEGNGCVDQVGEPGDTAEKNGQPLIRDGMEPREVKNLTYPFSKNESETFMTPEAN